MKQPAGDSSSYQLGLTLEPETPRPVRVPYRPPLARSTDPATSHIAADQVTRSGRRASLNQAVLAFLRVSGDSFTYREIAARIGERDAVNVMRRLNDLRKTGAAEKCGARNCSVNGNLMTTWRAR
jgi:hypothetical protein